MPVSAEPSMLGCNHNFVHSYVPAHCNATNVCSLMAK